MSARIHSYVYQKNMSACELSADLITCGGGRWSQPRVDARLRVVGQDDNREGHHRQSRRVCLTFCNRSSGSQRNAVPADLVQEVCHEKKDQTIKSYHEESAELLRLSITGEADVSSVLDSIRMGRMTTRTQSECARYYEWKSRARGWCVSSHRCRTSFWRCEFSSKNKHAYKDSESQDFSYSADRESVYAVNQSIGFFLYVPKRDRCRARYAWMNHHATCSFPANIAFIVHVSQNGLNVHWHAQCAAHVLYQRRLNLPRYPASSIAYWMLNMYHAVCTKHTVFSCWLLAYLGCAYGRGIRAEP